MIEKSCLHPGCSAYPMFGFGRPDQVMQWACRAHQAELNSRPSGPPPLGGMSGAGVTPVPAPRVAAALTPKQGSLL